MGSFEIVPKSGMALASSTQPAIYGEPAYNVVDSGWSKPVSLFPGIHLSNFPQVSCTSAQFCMLYDGAQTTWTWNGSTWTKVPQALTYYPLSSPGISVISCSDPSFCMIAENGVSYVYNGTSWEFLTANLNLNFVAMDCPSSGNCIALANSYALVFANGNWGSPEPLPPGEIDLACASTTQCMAESINGSLTLSIYDGNSWSNDPNVAPGPISCLGSGECISVGSTGQVEKWSNGIWSADGVLSGVQNLVNGFLSCSSVTYCYVGSYERLGYAFQYNGSTWLPVASVPEDFGSSTCAPGNLCMVICRGAIYEIENSVVSPPFFFNWSEASTAVACLDVSQCLIGGGLGSVATLDRRSNIESNRTIIGDGSPIESISCASSQFCITVDYDGYSASFNGTNWTPLSNISSTPTTSLVSCPTPTLCIATNISGTYGASSGANWSTSVGSGIALTSFSSFSCISQSSCFAYNGVTSYSYHATQGGGAWTQLSLPVPLGSISCVASSFCMNISMNGAASIYNGSSWTPDPAFQAANTTSSQINQSLALSCGSITFCVVISKSGVPLIFNGTSWITGSNTNEFGLQYLACGNIYCTGLSTNGNVTSYAAPSTFTPVSPTRVCDTRGSSPKNQCNQSGSSP
ncbi:MAG: hypothetical protein HKL80_07010, partial [Acidimicrobiales bacterium]|nr:hypothetical protein [Acidimicrobiales bacterium]